MSHTSRLTGRSSPWASADNGVNATSAEAAARNAVATIRNLRGRTIEGVMLGMADCMARLIQCRRQRTARFGGAWKRAIILGDETELKAMLRSQGLFRVALAIALVLGLGPPMARADGEADFLAGKTKSCVKCVLEKAQLKRRDL